MAEHLWRPFDRQHIANPYEMYRQLRERDPVHLSQTNEWIVTHYEDTRHVLRSPDFLVGNRFEWLKKGIGYFKYKDMDFTSIEQAMQGFILFLNPPHHTRIRKFIHQVWNGRDVESIIAQNLQKVFDNHNGRLDLIHDLGKPLPAMTIGRILGLAEKDYLYLKQLGSVMIKALDLYISFKDILQINEAAGNFMTYFENVIHEKEKNPDEGIISKLVQLNKQENVLDDHELISTCILLFIAGEETSVSLMGTGLYNLLSHPERMFRLRADRSLVPLAIEELIRYDAPVQIVGRIAGKDTELHGRQIKAGDTLTVCLGSANRDPQVFDQADEFIIDRDPNKHLGFGGGAHYCLGDWLARIQTRLTIETLLDRYKTIELVNHEPQWNNNLAIRCITSLPATVR